jgi:alanine dehydrogenase
MALLIRESDVLELFPMEQAIERVESSFIAQQTGRAVNRPRDRIFLNQTSLHYMAAALFDEKLLGMKIYTVSSGAPRFVVLLFDAENGELRAVIEADHLGRIRTGAASAVATKHLARQDAAHVAVIGAGRQARTQLEAVARVRRLSSVRVFSRNEERRIEFCREMGQRTQLAVQPARSAEEATRSADIVITATTARMPVLQGEWLQPGVHLNAIGSNMANRREVDDVTLAKTSLIAVDSIEQAKQEAGDLIQGLSSVGRTWENVVELSAIVAGDRVGRVRDDEVTLFKSCGIALWDVAAAGFIYRAALAKGVGVRLPIWDRDDKTEEGRRGY